MSCAAIGVAGGVIFTVNAWVGGALANLIPLIYGLTIGLYFIPGAVAQGIMRRPGVGLLTAAFSGLIASPFQPIFFGAFAISLLIGVLQELPFLVSRYRVWRPWLFAAGALVAGIVTSGATFQVLGGEDFGVAGTIVAFASFGLSPLIFTMLALWLSSALVRAGVGRGLRRDREVARAAGARASGASDTTTRVGTASNAGTATSIGTNHPSATTPTAKATATPPATTAPDSRERQAGAPPRSTE